MAEGGAGEQDARLDYATALVKLRLRPVKGEDTTGCEQAVQEINGDRGRLFGRLAVFVRLDSFSAVSFAVLVESQMRLLECMMLLTEAFYHLGDYVKAEECVNTALKWRARDPVALAWRDIVKGRLMKDGLIGAGIVVGLVGVGAAAAAYFRHRRRAQAA